MRKHMFNNLFWLLGPPGVASEMAYKHVLCQAEESTEANERFWKVYKCLLALGKSNK